MDTPIRLVSKKPQLDFLGEVTDKKLMYMTNIMHIIAIIATKWVLGEEFVIGIDIYKVNT